MAAIPKQPEGLPREGAAPPDPMRTLEEQAEAGDFATVLDWYIHAPPAAYSPALLDELLRHAIKQAARQSPRRFAEAGFRQTTAFLMYVLLRLQACMMQAVFNPDANEKMRRGQMPDGLTGDIQPAIERLSRLVGELHQAWASTARLWALTRRRSRPRPCDGRCRRPGDEFGQDTYAEEPANKPCRRPGANGKVR